MRAPPGIDGCDAEPHLIQRTNQTEGSGQFQCRSLRARRDANLANDKPNDSGPYSVERHSQTDLLPWIPHTI